MNQKIFPPDSLRGSLKLPPDKSISHRAAMFAAIANETSTIANYSGAADPQSTLQCLRQLGIPIQQDSNHGVRINGQGRWGMIIPEQPLNCGNSGTTMRLLTGLVAGAGLTLSVTGDASLRSRTMRRIIEPLRKMGVNIEAKNDDFAPLQINGRNTWRPIDFPLPIPSAQLKSCVLLAGLYTEEWTRVTEYQQSRDHTERLLNLPVEERENNRLICSNSQIHIPSQNYRIPSDFSAAAFWLVAGAIHVDADIELNGVGINPTRTALLDILREMGADIKIYNRREEGREPTADIRVSSSSLDAVELSPEVVPNCIDEIPILAVAMVFARGTSVIRGADELRHKETDRLEALADLFRKAGVPFEAFNDGMRIEGNPNFIPSRGHYSSHDDHRMAMSSAVLTLMGDGVSVIKDAEVAQISYPAFWEDLQSLILTN